MIGMLAPSPTGLALADTKVAASLAAVAVLLVTFVMIEARIRHACGPLLNSLAWRGEDGTRS